MSHQTATRSVPTDATGGVDRRPRVSASTWVVAASLAVGAATALILSLVVLAGGTEGVVTGSMLVGFGVGWAVLAILSARRTDRPQRWAAVPAVAMAGTGLALVATNPSNDTLTSMTWVWPPAMLVMLVWMVVQIRRHLAGLDRWLLAPVLAFLAIASVGAFAQNISAGSNADAYPAPGTTYSVGDHRLHLDCRGHGRPTVVLFNGLGEISDSWANVTARLGDDVRVCAYDRAGQGWSDDAPVPQDGVAAAADLHTLLEVAGEQGPFVLVGHSIGGPYAMTYAARYPDQVAGLVLLDSSSPRQFTAMPSYPLQYAFLRRLYSVMPALVRIGAGALAAPGSDYEPDVADRLHAMTSTPRAARGARDEVTVLPRLFEQAQALTTLRDIPLAVLTASQNAADTEGWSAAQDELASLSTQSTHTEADSSHDGLLAEDVGASASAGAIAAVVAAVSEPGHPAGATNTP